MRAAFLAVLLLGSTAPQLTVQPAGFGLFQPMSADSSTTINAAFTPDGQTVFFSKAAPGWSGLTIFESHREGSGWSEPTVAPFSGRYRDTDPAVTPDGTSVIFASERPPLGKPPFTYALYQAFIRGPKAGTVTPLPGAVNDGETRLYPTIASDQTLYFTGIVGTTSRIFRSQWGGEAYRAPEPVALPGDAATVNDLDASIDGDQRFLVFASNRPDSLGRTNLYVAFRVNQRWCAPVHLPEPINSTSAEIATGLSRDGRTLFFTSSRSDIVQPTATPLDASAFRAQMAHYSNGLPRIYRVDIGSWLDAMKPQSC